ncbi:YveK family protein [Paenibacillus solisilvae]|uniref:YveK family protein n=1 Tax=Paenibacillus solisilvae TaxID=2486751 RepID=A0ABW0VVL4_9BACL
MELKQFWSIVRKNIWMILVFVIISGTVTGIYSYYFLDKKYEASTKLIVNQNMDTATLNRIDINTINSNIQLVKTYKEIIKTPRIMSKVVAQFPDLKLTEDDLIRKVSVTSVNDTQVMSVTATDLSYRKATSIVNAVAQVFQKEIPTLMKVDNVNILNMANPNDKPAPVSPKPSLNIVISIILSLMVGLSSVFLIHYLDDTVKSETDVEQILGLPTLSLVPRMRKADKVSLKNKQTVTKPIRGEKNVTLDT